MTKAAGFLAASIAFCAWVGVESARASLPSLSERFEGSDFIANAARVAHTGMSAAAFLGRMEQDFVVIRDFPSELRWLVHDADDEAFLFSAASEVFIRWRWKSIAGLFCWPASTVWRADPARRAVAAYRAASG